MFPGSVPSNQSIDLRYWRPDIQKPFVVALPFHIAKQSQPPLTASTVNQELLLQ